MLSGQIKNRSWVIWGLIFLLATGLASLIPPMQSPDEMSHLGRAYLISQGQWFLDPLPQEIAVPSDNTQISAMITRARSLQVEMGGGLDEGLIAFADAHKASSVKLHAESDKAHIAHLQWTGKKRYFSLWGTAYYFPAVYIPQAAGLFIGEHLHWTVQQSYYLARTITLLACMILLSIAYKRAPIPPIGVALLLLPMSLFQMLSPTIDGLTTALAVMVMSQFVFALKNSGAALPIWHVAIAVFILATSRTHLMPMFLLPMYIAWQRRSWSDAWVTCLFGFAAVGWAVSALRSNNGLMLDPSHTSAGLLIYYAGHPWDFFEIAITTVTDPVQSIFLQRSFIGILGWLDTPLSAIYYPMLWAGLGICAAASMSIADFHVQRWGRLMLMASAAASVGIIFLALLVTFTPHPATLVQGIQGRYFLVPTLLMAYALSNHQKIQAVRWLLLLVFAILALSALITALISRYGAVI